MTKITVILGTTFPLAQQCFDKNRRVERNYYYEQVGDVPIEPGEAAWLTEIQELLDSSEVELGAELFAQLQTPKGLASASTPVLRQLMQRRIYNTSAWFVSAYKVPFYFSMQGAQDQGPKTSGKTIIWFGGEKVDFKENATHPSTIPCPLVDTPQGQCAYLKGSSIYKQNNGTIRAPQFANQDSDCLLDGRLRPLTVALLNRVARGEITPLAAIRFHLRDIKALLTFHLRSGECKPEVAVVFGVYLEEVNLALTSSRTAEIADLLLRLKPDSTKRGEGLRRLVLKSRCKLLRKYAEAESRAAALVRSAALQLFHKTHADKWVVSCYLWGQAMWRTGSRSEQQQLGQLAGLTYTDLLRVRRPYPAQVDDVLKVMLKATDEKEPLVVAAHWLEAGGRLFQVREPRVRQVRIVLALSQFAACTLDVEVLVERLERRYRAGYDSLTFHQQVDLVVREFQSLEAAQTELATAADWIKRGGRAFHNTEPKSAEERVVERLNRALKAPVKIGDALDRLIEKRRASGKDKAEVDDVLALMLRRSEETHELERAARVLRKDRFCDEPLVFGEELIGDELMRALKVPVEVGPQLRALGVQKSGTLYPQSKRTDGTANPMREKLETWRKVKDKDSIRAVLKQLLKELRHCLGDLETASARYPQEVLRLFRDEKLGWSQKRIAKELALRDKSRTWTQPRISDLERGVIPLTRPLAAHFADITGIPLCFWICPGDET